MFHKALAKKIDHTLLTPNCTYTDIERLCSEATAHGFAAVCVPPYYVKDAARLLEDKMTKVATVIGFPMGYSNTPAKVEEVKRAIDEGVDEIDVVINILAVKNGNWSYVRNDIDSMTRAAHLKGKQIKVIVEVSLLTDAELKQVCDLCNEIDVNYVKTSTGFIGSPVNVQQVKQLRDYLKPEIRIKASGGIKTSKFAEELIDAGATRLGASASLEIVRL